MSKIYQGAVELIGNTPLVEVINLEKEQELKARVLVKLEYLNPAGSVKDRIAKAMLEDFREYWYRTGSDCRIQGLSCDLDHAGDHERRAPQHSESIRRRDRADTGRERHEGCHRACQGTGGRDSRWLYSGTV